MKKHLSLNERFDIENSLYKGMSFKEIGKNIGKNCTTISREIRNHYVIKNTGSVGRNFNNCIYRSTCPNRGKNCNLNNCTEFKEQKCNLLDKPPYVCNGCKYKTKCTLTKHFYDAVYANEILTSLICEQNQSIHQVLLNNKNKIMFSDKSIYKYIDLGILNVRNIDLPRKVRFRNRTKPTTVYKIDKKCLENRTYEDYLDYIKEHPDTPVVEMDSVEGKKGGKVLLTIHFVNCSFMLAFIREHNDAQSVIDIFNWLQSRLGIDKFKELFVIILTDNGSEFSNPTEIEFDLITREKRTQIFYCHPSSPFEKGSCEVNHELLRRILPKGTSFDELTQNDINLIMSHINSYKRKKLNNVSPYKMFSTIYGKDTIDKLGIQEIEPNNVSLSSSILK